MTIDNKHVEKDLEYYSKLPYTVILEKWDDGDGPYWVARIAELPHCLIHGDSPQEAVGEIEEVKKDWIRSNLGRALPIPEPVARTYSGQLTLRIPPSLHRTLSQKARLERVSLNHYMTAALAMYVDMGTGTLTVENSRERRQPASPKRK